jgi:glycine/D-amino acid oxidase-like deaminating enzyme
MLSRVSLRHVAAPLRLGRQFTNTASGTFARPSDAPLPSHARVVVIGGGIIGNSVLYHLAKGGWKDVVLLERSQLTSGTTWHAAGLMATFGSKSETSTELRKYSKAMYVTCRSSQPDSRSLLSLLFRYASLEGETGLATGWKGVGFIELASDTDRLEEYRRVAAFNRKCGIDVHEITPGQVKELFPLCKTDDLLAGFYVRCPKRRKEKCNNTR